MDKKLLKIILLALIIVIAIPIISEASDTVVVKEIVAYRDDAVEMELEIPVFYNWEDWLQQEFINAKLREEHFAFAFKIASFAKFFYQDYSEDIAHFWPFQIFTSFEVTYDKNNILSLATETYQYTGGAHGTTELIGFNWNRATGKKFTLANLNSPNYKEIILEEINRQIDLQPEFYFADEIPVTDFIEDDFYLTEDGVVIFYQLYDIAPYAHGIQRFLIPWSLLHSE